MSQIQKTYLIDYLVEHPTLVTRKFSPTFTQHDYEKEWEILAAKCNELQGPQKKVHEWKKVILIDSSIVSIVSIL